MPAQEALAVGTIMLTFILTVGSVLGALIKSHRDRRIAKLRVDLQSELLQRFESASEVLDYLKSEAGVQFAESASLERGSALNRMLGSLQIGIVATFVGAGLGLVRWTIDFEQEMRQGLGLLGAVGVALGLGFIVSSLVGIALTRRFVDDPVFGSGKAIESGSE